MIQSHRGAGDLAPENTLESFAFAWEMGTVPEADVRLTSDGVFVAFHDPHLRRTPSGIPEEWRDLGIEDLSWQQVSGIDVGAYKGAEFRGQRIPSIASVLSEVRADKTRFICLDIKHAPLDRLAVLCRESGVLERCIVASTDYDLLREWDALASESETMLWMGGSEEHLEARLQTLREAGFQGVAQLQIHVRATEAGSPGRYAPRTGFLREVANELRARGIMFLTFPMGELGRDPAVYQDLMATGSLSFATDDPRTALSVIGREAAAYSPARTRTEDPHP